MLSEPDNSEFRNIPLRLDLLQKKNLTKNWPTSQTGGRSASARNAVSRYQQTYPQNLWLVEGAKRELRGKDLACGCPLDLPVNADFLPEVANKDCALHRLNTLTQV